MRSRYRTFMLRVNTAGWTSDESDLFALDVLRLVERWNTEGDITEPLFDDSGVPT